MSRPMFSVGDIGYMRYFCGENGEIYDVQYNAYGDGIDDRVLIELVIEHEECAIMSEDVDKLRDFLSNK